jgi:hypothetical protein
MALLVAFLHASVVVIIEVSDDDAEPIHITRVADGDTVELADRRIRLVGFDTYEMSEPLGRLARDELRSLCLGKEAYLDVDDLEPSDRHGRVLGYLWCRRGAGNITWHVSVQKHFIIGEGRKYVKQLLHISPDEHPYTLWMIRHTIRFNRAVEIYVYNDTKSPHKIYGNVVVLTSGVYEVYYGGQLVARLRLMSHTPNTTTINLPTADATPTTVAAVEPQQVTVTTNQIVTRTVATTTTQTATSVITSTRTATLKETETHVVTKTATTAVAVEKPYVHPITYIVTAAAAAVLAIYIARRSRPAARR